MSEISFPLASWKRRALAWGLDAIIVTIPSSLVITLIGIGNRQVEKVVNHKTTLSSAPPTLGNTILEALIWIAFFTIYSALGDGSLRGQTLGKRWLGIATVNSNDGEPIGIIRGALRGFISSLLISAGLLVGIINFLWPFWDPQMRTWHDMITKSAVIQVRAS